MSDIIKNGDIIAVKYVGKLDGGEIFDSTDETNPLYFKVGDGEVLPKFEESVIGMKVGDKKSIVLSQDDAYGPRDEKRLLNVTKQDFPDQEEIYPGMQFYYKDPSGETAYAYIENINGDDVIINFNHPLAGLTLHFDYEILSINAIDEDQLNAFYSGCNCNCDSECGEGCSCSSCN